MRPSLWWGGGGEGVWMFLIRISNRVISCFEEKATSLLLHHILPIFKSIVAISSCLMSLVQGHVTCQSFALTGRLIHVSLGTKDFICISSTYFAETYLFFQLSMSTILSAYTVEPRLTTTPFVRPPRYYGHILSNQT